MGKRARRKGVAAKRRNPAAPPSDELLAALDEARWNDDSSLQRPPRRARELQLQGHAAILPLDRPVAGYWGRPLIVRLGDDEVGYCMDMKRTDDCLRAAVATATQVPPEQVPDPRLDARLAAGEDPDEISREVWDRLEVWAGRRGLELVFHEMVPRDGRVPRVERERWVAVCAAANPPRDLVFNDHCLVMAFDRIVFDPSIRTAAAARSSTWLPSQFLYGMSFDPIDQKESDVP